VNVDGYHLLPDGRQLLSFDTTVKLSASLTAGPGDVVRFNGTSYALVFNAAANGVPRGANVDAVAMDGSDLLLSFDVTVSLPGGVTARPADLVRFAGGVFTIYFDGAAAGLAPGLDLDAADVLPNGRLLVSFDGSGVIGGVGFDDEDVLEHDRVSGTW
jgi:hypothetical protein